MSHFNVILKTFFCFCLSITLITSEETGIMDIFVMDNQTVHIFRGEVALHAFHSAFFSPLWILLRMVARSKAAVSQRFSGRRGGGVKEDEGSFSMVDFSVTNFAWNDKEWGRGSL